MPRFLTHLDSRGATFFASCCGTTFVAADVDRAKNMHRDHHNLMYDRGRRTHRVPA